MEHQEKVGESGKPRKGKERERKAAKAADQDNAELSGFGNTEATLVLAKYHFCVTRGFVD